MRITVVTPWLNHLELARDYWNALRGQDAEVLVIDNGSEPPLPNAYRLKRNLGFSSACNVGLDLARSEAVLFLNNDIVAFDSDWLEPITKALEPGVLVGQLRYEEHGDVDGQQFPYIDGWCLAGMREDLVALEGFDESYEEPAYYSDNDLCLRARIAGMSLREVPIGLYHKGGQTTQANGFLLPSSIANKARFERTARELVIA